MLKKLMRYVLERTSRVRWRIELSLRMAAIVGTALLELSCPRLARRLRPIGVKDPGTAGQTLLIVSYYAPPYKSTYGTQRIAKFAKYLSRLGWKIVFLTTAPQKGYEIDQNSEPLVNGIQVIRIQPMPLHPFYRQGLFVPDDFVFWVPRFTAAITEILNTQPISAILVTIPPYSVALASAVAATRSGVPLVTDFRDPWSRIDSGWVLRGRWRRALSARIERAVIAVSRRVIMVSDLRYQRDYFANDGKVEAGKIVSIRNGYDDDDFIDSDSTSDFMADVANGDFVISYAGLLYNEENLDNIENVFAAFKHQHPSAAARICFHYAGSSGAMLTARPAFPIRYVNHGFLTHRHSNGLRKHSDVQLFAQPKSYPAHVSSGKIFEMIRAGVPIFAITRADGTVTQLVKETATGVAFDPADIDNAVAALKDMFDAWTHTGCVGFAPNAERISAYSRPSLTAQLSTILADLVTASSSRS